MDSVGNYIHTLNEKRLQLMRDLMRLSEERRPVWFEKALAFCSFERKQRNDILSQQPDRHDSVIPLVDVYEERAIYECGLLEPILRKAVEMEYPADLVAALHRVAAKHADTYFPWLFFAYLATRALTAINVMDFNPETFRIVFTCVYQWGKHIRDLQMMEKDEVGLAYLVWTYLATFTWFTKPTTWPPKLTEEEELEVLKEEHCITYSAAKYLLDTVVQQQDKEASKYLLDTVVQQQDKEASEQDWTFMHLAAAYGDVSSLNKLLEYSTSERGIRMTKARTQIEGFIPLHLAAIYGHAEMVKTLLKLNPNSCFVKD